MIGKRVIQLLGFCLCFALLVGCQKRTVTTAPLTPGYDLTPYEQERFELRQRIESARHHNDPVQEREDLILYNQTYEFSEQMVLRELDLHIELDEPQRVVMIVDRLLPEQRTHAIFVRLGSALERLDDYDAAVEAYENALKISHRSETLDLFMAARLKVLKNEMSDLVSDYGDSPWLTRDEFALILIDRFQYYLPTNTRAPVIVDIDQSSHPESFLAAVSAGLIPIGRDHRTRPSARVRKTDVINAFYMILHYADALPDHELPGNMDIPSDLSASHSAWKSALTSLTLGLVNTEADGRFQSGKILNGSEIVIAIEAISSYLQAH